MKSLRHLVLLGASVILASCGGGGSDTETTVSQGPIMPAPNSLEAQFNAADCSAHNPFSQPTGSTIVLCRSGYTVGYNTFHEQPAWTSYYVNAELANRQVSRTEDFREDLDLSPAFRSTLDDYSGSGFDRGHMSPAATVGFDRKSMSESFLLSNMSPQLPEFNRGGWADLEEKVRECATTAGDLVVVSGAVYQSPSPARINGDGPSVPDRFYKVILKTSEPRQIFAVSIKHEGFTLNELGGFVVSPDEVELQTGIDLFSGLPDELEVPLEASSVDFCGIVTAAAPAPTPTPTPTPSPEPFPTPSPGPFGPCGNKSTCSVMTSCSEANYYYRTCGVSRLDGDNDGTPCEALCR